MACVININSHETELSKSNIQPACKKIKVINQSATSDNGDIYLKSNNQLNVYSDDCTFTAGQQQPFHTIHYGHSQLPREHAACHRQPWSRRDFSNQLAFICLACIYLMCRCRGVVYTGITTVTYSRVQLPIPSDTGAHICN